MMSNSDRETEAASRDDAHAASHFLSFKLEPGKLYDRQDEIARLQAAYHGLLTAPRDDDIWTERTAITRELVLLYGYSGTGKTALGLALAKHVAEKGGIFLHGKFDQLRTPKPFAAFLQAFTQYVDLTEAKGMDEVHRVRLRIEELVQSECQLLTDMLPALERILGRKENGAPAPQGAQERLKFVFRRFVRSICSIENHPVVLMLDDLQWADSGSLKLLDALVTDSETTNSLLVVGICRHKEVTLTGELASTLRALEDGGIIINNIRVHNLSEKATHEMVSDLLNQSKDESKMIASLVWKQTKGNPVFVVHFLRALEEEGLLHFDSKTSKWTWKQQGSAGESILEGDVVSLLARTIRHLAIGVQDELKVAACLGTEFTAELLRHASSERNALDKFLQTTVERGLVEFNPKTLVMSFSHDRVQQAAYSLIADTERSSFHLELGRRLLKSLSLDQQENFLFVVVSQLMKGVDLVEDQEEKYRFAELFLKGGQRAVLSSAFATSLTYFRLGIDLLGDSCWKDRYHLSLSLFDATAEAAYCNGDFDLVDRCIKQVLENASSFDDKIRACQTQVYTLGARDMLDESIDKGFAVLGLLGEPFPSSAGNAVIVLEVLRTKYLLWGKKDSDLLQMPKMIDRDKLAAHQMLNLLFLHVFQARPSFVPLVALRIVRLTIRYGMSPVSALGFALYGMILCGSLGDMEQGYRFGRLALKIHDLFGANEWIPRVYAGVYGCINHWKRPLRSGLEGIKHASHMGFMTGDIEYGSLEANVYALSSFDTGRPLDRVELILRKNCRRIKSYNQETELWLARIVLQGVLNLRGHHETADPLVLTGEVLDQEEAMAELKAKNHATFICFVYIMRLWVAYILCEYEAAKHMAEQSRNVETVAFCTFDTSTQTFLDGMTALALVQYNRKRNLRRARKCLRKMTHWAKHCPENFLNKRYLLEAEFAVIRGNEKVAMEKYTSGIALSKTYGFLAEEAIGQERLGRYLLSRHDGESATVQLKRALEAYSKWKADEKVDRLTKEFPFLP